MTAEYRASGHDELECLARAVFASHLANSLEGISVTRAATWNEADFATPDAERLARDEDTVRRGFWRKLKRFAAQLPFAEDLAAAYYCAFDRDTPLQVKAALVGALAYFVLPFDVIPDMMPLLGFADDAAVLATALRLVASHMKPEHCEAAKRAMAGL